MINKEINIREFASRVERMCEFILYQIEEKDGSPDIVFVQKLKEDAAFIQYNPRPFDGISIKGLDDHTRGILKSE